VAVTIDDVHHIAALSRISLTGDRAAIVMGELNTILGHMDILTRVDTEGVQEAIGIGAQGLPVRADGAAPVALARSLDAFAPALRDGFFLVPRLATHESTEES
jgi:aspartyl-tRNA(Asn)/glutamyl-tRNA(Gln) amidotransferase subunit C